MRYETAGDPITGLKWTRKTTEKVTNELKALGIKEVNRTSVGRLLKELGYSLKVNHKKRALGENRTPEARAQRDQQFEYINLLRTQFADEGNPTISVDSKKKEMVGAVIDISQELGNMNSSVSYVMRSDTIYLR